MKPTSMKRSTGATTTASSPMSLFSKRMSISEEHEQAAGIISIARGASAACHALKGGLDGSIYIDQKHQQRYAPVPPRSAMETGCSSQPSVTWNTYWGISLQPMPWPPDLPSGRVYVCQGNGHQGNVRSDDTHCHADAIQMMPRLCRLQLRA